MVTCSSHNVLFYWHTITSLQIILKLGNSLQQMVRMWGSWVPGVPHPSQPCSASHSTRKWWNRTLLSSVCLVAQEPWTVRLWGRLRFGWLLCTALPEHQHSYKQNRGYAANICPLLDRAKGLRASNFLSTSLVDIYWVHAGGDWTLSTNKRSLPDHYS